MFVHFHKILYSFFIRNWFIRNRDLANKIPRNPRAVKYLTKKLHYFHLSIYLRSENHEVVKRRDPASGKF